MQLRKEKNIWEPPWRTSDHIKLSSNFKKKSMSVGTSLHTGHLSAVARACPMSRTDGQNCCSLSCGVKQNESCAIIAICTDIIYMPP
jgi:hypothetical protein